MISVEAVRPPRIRDGDATVVISLLGGFRVTIAGGDDVGVSFGAQRMLAFLALRNRTAKRATIAGTLWPDVPQDRAFASLRAALARLNAVCGAVLRATPLELRLTSQTSVDVEAGRELAMHLINDWYEPSATELGHDAITVLSTDLLPEFQDEWVVPDAEGWRHLRMRALEALASRLIKRQRFCDASLAAMAAVAADPLRETARALLIRVHIAEGNQSDAIREFRGYKSLLRSEFGLEPSMRLQELVHDLGAS